MALEHGRCSCDIVQWAGSQERPPAQGRAERDSAASQWAEGGQGHATRTVLREVGRGVRKQGKSTRKGVDDVGHHSEVERQVGADNRHLEGQNPRNLI